MAYLGQKRCHFFFYGFFILLISCNGSSSKTKTEVSPNQIKSLNQVIKDGEVIIYHKNGQPQSVGNFVKGIAHGPIIVYDSNGYELYRGMFKDGKPSGEWVFTNPKNNEKTIKSY